MDGNDNKSIRVMKSKHPKQRYMKLYQKCSDNFKNYLHLYKHSVRLVVREPQNSFYSVKKVKANDFIKGNLNNVGVFNGDVVCGKVTKKKNLTPLPYKSTKRVSSSKEQKDLKSLERNAVVMRMIEYAQHIKSNKNVKSKYINKVDLIIYIQKILRGHILRKAVRDVLLLHSKLKSFITRIKNYSLIKVNHVQNKKQNTHKISNTRNNLYNLRNISPCITSNSVSKKSNSKSRYGNKIKLVKNINKYLSSNSVNHTHKQVKPVSKIPSTKINKTYSNNKCLRFNKPPKKPTHSSKLHINTTNSNSNSVLANYLNNCTSNVTEAYTPLNVTTNPTSKSTNRISKHKYSQHNCVSFVVFPTKYVNSIGVQTVISSDESENENMQSFNVTGNNSVIVNNPFNTYQNNSCLISKQYKECLSSKEQVSHLGGVKGYNNSLRVTQDKSFEIDSDVKKHNGMMMSYNLVSKINSIEFKYVPEMNADKSSTNHKEMNLSQISIEGNNNTLNRVIHIKQLPKELGDNSYTKLTLHSAIHDIVASKIILIQSSIRKYFNSAVHEVDNGNIICKRNIHLNSYVTKVVKVDLTKRLNVIETAVKGMLCKKGFYNNNKKDPTLLAVTLLIVKRFSFSVKFYIFRLLKRKYCYNVFPSESMNTIQDDYDLNDERSKKLNCLFNEVIFDLKKDNMQKVTEKVKEVPKRENVK